MCVSRQRSEFYHVSAPDPLAGQLAPQDPNNPRLCKIIELNESAEIDLATALALLRDATAYLEIEDSKVQFGSEVKAGTLPPLTGHDLEDFKAACAYLINADREWDDWTKWGLAIHAATRSSDEGFELFDRFSQQASNYDPATTQERWEGICRSPPNRTGPNKIFKAARERGWIRPVHYVPADQLPPLDIGEEVEAARAALRQQLREALWRVKLPPQVRDTLSPFSCTS